MTFIEFIACLIFPPLAVIDRGCGSICIVAFLCLFGWIPGVIVAAIILSNPKTN